MFPAPSPTADGGAVEIEELTACGQFPENRHCTPEDGSRQLLRKAKTVCGRCAGDLRTHLESIDIDVVKKQAVPAADTPSAGKTVKNETGAGGKHCFPPTPFLRFEIYLPVLSFTISKKAPAAAVGATFRSVHISTLRAGMVKSVFKSWISPASNAS